MSWKLVRAAHISEEGVHRTFRSTYAHLISGRFPIVCSNMTLMIRKFMSSCVQCKKYNEQKFKMELQPVYTNVCKDVHPFQQVSVDMLGKMDILPWPEARKTIEVYPLLVKCIATSAVVMTIMETAKTISVILGLLQVEVKLGIKFESLTYWSDNAH